MQIGYRIIRPSDTGTQKVNLAQISLWRRADWGVSDGERGVREAIEIAQECRRQGIRTVFHPLEYPLTGEPGAETVRVLKKLAAESDLGIIVHDEGAGGGRQLAAAAADQYRTNVRAASDLCPISIENSYSSPDILSFWQQFVVPMPESVSITLDIGHLEGAGINSVSFVQALPQHLVPRLRFVHIHHHDEHAQGVKDHRPLVPGCREIEALKLLNEKKRDLFVIVELDASDEGMNRSIQLLKKIFGER